MAVGTFFGTIFITAPIVQSMWKILVFPSYKISLPTGAIVFVFLFSNLIKFKIDEEKKTPLELFTFIISFYCMVGILWVMAYFYSYWI
jgi:hypothetical protein